MSCACSSHLKYACSEIFQFCFCYLPLRLISAGRACRRFIYSLNKNGLVSSRPNMSIFSSASLHSPSNASIACGKRTSKRLLNFVLLLPSRFPLLCCIQRASRTAIHESARARVISEDHPTTESRTSYRPFFPSSAFSSSTSSSSRPMNSEKVLRVASFLNSMFSSVLFPKRAWLSLNMSGPAAARYCGIAGRHLQKLSDVSLHQSA